VCVCECECVCVRECACACALASMRVCVCMCGSAVYPSCILHAHVCMEVRVCINICKSDPLFFGRIISDTSEKSSEYDADTHVPTYS